MHVLCSKLCVLICGDVCFFCFFFCLQKLVMINRFPVDGASIPSPLQSI